MFILVYSRSMTMAHGVLSTLKSLASFRDRWFSSTEAKQVHVIATADIPNIHPSEDQKEHEDNKNEIHVFLQNIGR